MCPVLNLANCKRILVLCGSLRARDHWTAEVQRSPQRRCASAKNIIYGDGLARPVHGPWGQGGGVATNVLWSIVLSSLVDSTHASLSCHGTFVRAGSRGRVAEGGELVPSLVPSLSSGPPTVGRFDAGPGRVREGPGRVKRRMRGGRSRRKRSSGRGKRRMRRRDRAISPHGGEDEGAARARGGSR